MRCNAINDNHEKLGTWTSVEARRVFDDMLDQLRDLLRCHPRDRQSHQMADLMRAYSKNIARFYAANQSRSRTLGPGP